MKADTSLARPWWAVDQVLLRRKVLAIAPQFHVYDPQGGLLLYCHQKLLTLKEDIRVYSDDSKQHEILTVKARQIIDFSAAYDVFDAQQQIKVGALRRRGLKSILRDEWQILDVNDQPIGLVREAGSALLHRLFTFLPQRYTISLGDQQVGTVRQHFNPFVFKATLDLSGDPKRSFDRRLAMAAGLLLLAIERRQQ